MPLVHVVRPHETMLAIAEQYGFRAWQTIADAPENAELIERRGNAHALREGDELHIPDAQLGECLVPTAGPQGLAQTGLEGAAKHHKRVLETHKPLLEVRVYVEFRRVPEGVAAGAKNGTIQGWVRGTTHVTVKEASISITPDTIRGGATDRHGISRFEALTDGRWTLSLQPHPDQTSPGPAMPDAIRDHGLDFGKGNVVRERARSDNVFLEVEYRPLELEIEVIGGAIAGVTITSKKPDDRPFHAVCFWHDGVEPGPKGVTQVLEIDLKPDFLRKVDAGGAGVHPMTRPRGKRGIRLFQIHATGGNRISGALAGFINKKNGIHFINDRDGHVLRMVDDKYEVTHGGGKNSPVQFAWADQTNVNDQAIGVENVHGGDAEFPDAQIAALIGLVKKARELYPAILINHVMAHCDVFTGKPKCPGPKFPWETLEDAGVALKPREITDAQLETEWGGFFAAAKGKTRRLKQGDRDRKDDDGTFSVVRGGKAIASGLSLGPVALLNEALHAIGYTPNRNGKRVADFETWKTKNLGTFGASTKLAIRFFKKHYCTDTRPATSNKPLLDASLAKLVLGCYRTLTS